MAQIDIINGRATPHMHFAGGFRYDVSYPAGSGTDLSDYIANTWQVTHDSSRAFASASWQTVQDISVTGTRHLVRHYAGWGAADVPCFEGRLVENTPTLTGVGATLAASGWLEVTTEPLGEGRHKAFCYAPTLNVADISADLVDQVPDGYQLVPVRNDADVIIHLLESYGILLAPDGPGHSIETARVVAQLSPILLPDDQPGYSLIQQLDQISGGFVTFDASDGSVKRRRLYSVAPTSVVHVFTKGVDLLADPRITRNFGPYNQVVVQGAYNPSLGDYTRGYAPADPLNPGEPGTPAASPFIHNPPGTRTYTINNPLAETVTDCELIAADWLDVLSQSFSEGTLLTFACADIDIGDPIGIDANPMIFSNAVVISRTLRGDGLMDLGFRLADYD